MKNNHYFSKLKKGSLRPFRFQIFRSTITYMVTLFAGLALFASCIDNEDEYVEEPTWLGASIYDYLKSNGNFTYYVRLIEDLDYKEVLSLTGSKTLFVAKDSSFNEFFKNNAWNVSSYEELSLDQKKQIFKYSMINNAYLIERLSNYYYGGVYSEGSAMRRLTALSALDIIFHDSGDQVPDGQFWDRFKEKGIYLLKDETDMPIVFFSQHFIDKFSVTDEDFSFISGGKTRSKNDFHIFNKKLIDRDIVCKNGYIHVMEDVLLPPVNMAEYIATNPNTKIFSKLLDRFSAPYYMATLNNTYKALHPDFQDSIFAKQYFANNGGYTVKPDGKTATVLLSYSPGWNAYTTSSIYPDMAAMFVPTDDVMNDFFNNDPTGSLLKERYGSWENLPEDVAASFLKRHMRNSLVESLPSRFDKMVDEENYRLPVVKDDILREQNYTAVNGEVYLTKKVYTPADFISVYGPVLLSENARIMNWAINRTETANDGTIFAFYRLYLNSLVVKYGLFIPSDEYLDKYIDPIAYGQSGTQAVLKYWLNEKTATPSVNATVYAYTKATGEIGDSIGVITSADFLKDRLWKLLDSHIVVGDVAGDGYYITKANDIIKISNGKKNIQGGYDLDVNTSAEIIRTFPQQNGTTYLLNAPIQSALKSTYSVLSNITEKSEFSDFFELLEGVPVYPAADSISQIFEIKGVDRRISFFNAYNYTIYVPSNSAVQEAIRSGKIKTWTDISNLPADQQKKEAKKLLRFLRYHFQDKAVFVGENVNDIYQSSTLKQSSDNFPSHFKTTTNKYYKLGVKSVDGEGGQTLELTTENQKTARVKLIPGYYNIVTKDYIFSDLPSKFKNADGTGTASAAFSSSTIRNSSSAVIHLIDNVLSFD